MFEKSSSILDAKAFLLLNIVQKQVGEAKDFEISPKSLQKHAELNGIQMFLKRFGETFVKVSRLIICDNDRRLRC